MQGLTVLKRNKKIVQSPTVWPASVLNQPKCLFLVQVSASRVNDRHGWLVQCNKPLQFMSLHIPEENRF